MYYINQDNPKETTCWLSNETLDLAGIVTWVVSAWGLNQKYSDYLGSSSVANDGQPWHAIRRLNWEPPKDLMILAKLLGNMISKTPGDVSTLFQILGTLNINNDV